MHKLTLFLATALLFSCAAAPEAYEPVRPRTIVTTDGECDDIDSFVRLLLYSNEMDIVGLVYSSSQWHWAGDGQGSLLVPMNRYEGPRAGMAPPQMEPKESHRWIGKTWMQELIGKYGECWPMLRKHDARYPSPEYLLSILREGNIRVEGDMEQPTEGSDYIKELILDDVPGPLFAQVWGGTNTVARALLSIEEQYKGTPEWDSVYKKVSDKLVIYIIQGQDGTWENYVSAKWPEVRTIYNADQFFCFAYLWRRSVPNAYLKTLDGDWFRDNILENHGPLTASYLTMGSGYDIHDPDDHYGDPEMVNRMPGAKLYDFISEGDSPSYFHLFDFFGLRSLEHPEWGGMGGRFNKQEGRQVWKDPAREGGFGFGFPGGPRGRAPQPERPKVVFDRLQGDTNPDTGEVDMFYPQARWVEVLQNDFAARADWCVKDYADANHMPAVSVKGGLDITAKPGEKVTLQGAAKDPDGNAVSLRWWQYREAGTCDAVLDIQGSESEKVTFVIPDDAPSGSTFHVILQGTDNGTPALSHFQRVIVTVK